MKSAEPALCIFDVCGTLYAANTTSGFLAFYHQIRGHRLRGLVCRSITSRLSPLRYLSHLAGKALGRDLGRAILISTLKGEAAAEVAVVADRYVEERLGKLEIAHSQRLLDQHRLRAERIVLMSNSIAPVIKAIAETLQVDYRASSLARDGAAYSGRIERDLTGRKHLALADLLAEYERRPVVHVVTDNGSDRALLDAADVRTVICPRGRRPDAFRGLEADYVDVA